MSSGKKVVSKLDQVCKSAAERELERLATEGMHHRTSVRFEYAVDDHGVAVIAKNFAQRHADLLPAGFRDGTGRLACGFFQSLTLPEILKLFFKEDAIAFLLKHSYNEWLFWANLLDVSRFFTREKYPLPYSMPMVEHYLSVERTPFGKVSRSELGAVKLRLKAEILANKSDNSGVFDPNKLSAAYACQLLVGGFLLQCESDSLAESAPLVVNPMFQDLIV